VHRVRSGELSATLTPPRSPGGSAQQLGAADGALGWLSRATPAAASILPRRHLGVNSCDLFLGRAVGLPGRVTAASAADLPPAGGHFGPPTRTAASRTPTSRPAPRTTRHRAGARHHGRRLPFIGRPAVASTPIPALRPGRHHRHPACGRRGRPRSTSCGRHRARSRPQTNAVRRTRAQPHKPLLVSPGKA
jgi:hypothetical protein